MITYVLGVLQLVFCHLETQRSEDDNCAAIFSVACS